jgi:NADPH-dependent 2,4-dienoyl-CoA reductase/sulfur reductase-like enzyme
MQKVVVVGASLAGLRSAQALRKRGFDGRLVLVGDEPHQPYDRPPLSKQLLSGEWPAEKLFFGAREKHTELQLELVLGRKARALDVRARNVMLEDGTSIDYDGLVIATGTAPRVLPNPDQLDARDPCRAREAAARAGGGSGLHRAGGGCLVSQARAVGDRGRAASQAAARLAWCAGG